MGNDLIKNLSASRKRGAQNWAYKRTLNGADYATDGVRAGTVGTAGSGYLVAPAVSFTLGAGDTTGAGAAAHTTIGPTGAVTGIIIDNPGSGYTVIPTIALAAPPSGGVQANGTVQLIDVWHEGSLRKASEINFDQPDETDELEDGMETYPEAGKVTGNLKLTLGQDDMNTIKFLMRESKKYEFSLLYEKGKSTNNTTQLIFVPYTRCGRKYSSKSGDRKPEADFKIMKNLSAVIPSNLPSFVTNGAVVADFTVPAEEYFEPLDK
jgi:hypothetical protein